MYSRKEGFGFAPHFFFSDRLEEKFFRFPGPTNAVHCSLEGKERNIERKKGSRKGNSHDIIGQKGRKKERIEREDERGNKRENERKTK